MVKTAKKMCLYFIRSNKEVGLNFIIIIAELISIAVANVLKISWHNSTNTPFAAFGMKKKKTSLLSAPRFGLSEIG